MVSTLGSALASQAENNPLSLQIGFGQCFISPQSKLKDSSFRYLISSYFVYQHGCFQRRDTMENSTQGVKSFYAVTRGMTQNPYH